MKLKLFLFGNIIPFFLIAQHKTVRETINLGETPWRFAKVEKTKQVNLAKKINPQIQNNGQDYTIKLNQPDQIGSFQIIFKNQNIGWTKFTLEALTTNGNWETINSFEKGKGAKVNAKVIDDVGKTGKTVGLVKKVLYKYFEVKTQGKFQAFRVTHLKCSQKKGEFFIPKNVAFEIYNPIPHNHTKAQKSPNFDDSKWEKVGIPHCFNDDDTYLNNNNMAMWKGETWYRKKITLPKTAKGKKLILEFKGVNIAAAVYINGHFKSGNYTIKQPDEVTHVGGFLPFALDITNDIVLGKENTIAVRVSNEKNGFYTDPGFGNYEGFGMGWGGIVSPVFLHMVNQVHIPLNVYAPQKKWGTYFACTSINGQNASVKSLTNVENSTSNSQQVNLITYLIDRDQKIVTQMNDTHEIKSGTSHVFNQTTTVNNAHLWFPNSDKLKAPYLYTVKHQLKINNKIIDEYTYKTGLRSITWDDNYCYVNGKQTFLQGFGHRNSYPALGSAVPEALQYKDISLIANAGGNTLRVGHVPATKTTVNACDEYGILVMQNSGDNEWVLKGKTTNAYKTQYDKEMIVAYRNHPSIAVWESNNGLPKKGAIYQPINTQKIVMELDSLQPRIVHNRDKYPSNWPDSLRIMVGYTNKYKKVAGSPSINTEVYGAKWGGQISWNIARWDYENEETFTDYFVNNYLKDKKNKACGWIDWMLAETQGEGYTIYLNGKKNQKSLGSCALDGNRFPKLKYQVYKNALWVNYNTCPGVCLQSSWNNTPQKQHVVAWSNCPKVELFLNQKSLGIRTPDSLTKKCVWENINWKAGTLKAIGLSKSNQKVCEDIKVSSGAPKKIVLFQEPNVVSPNGKTFTNKANGSDAIIVTAKILDEQGNLCVNANNEILFSLNGDAEYRGSYNFYVQDSGELFDYAPKSTTLKAEGGLIRIAVKAGFKKGIVSLKAQSTKLESKSINIEFH